MGLGDSGSADTAASYDTADAEFILIYHDPYGGVWRTDGIEGASSDDMVASNVQPPSAPFRTRSSTALSSPAAFTPPRAASAPTTASTTSPATPRSTLAGTSTPSSARTAAPSPRSPPTLAMEFTVTFADKPGQTGVQYLFEYDTNSRGAGSFPVSAGIA